MEMFFTVQSNKADIERVSTASEISIDKNILPKVEFRKSVKVRCTAKFGAIFYRKILTELLPLRAD